jgi:hypothetical protein
VTRKTADALVTAGVASLEYYAAEAKQQLFDLQDGTVREPAAVWALDPSSEWHLLWTSLGLAATSNATSILTTMRDMYDELPPERKLQLKHPLRSAAAPTSAFRLAIAELPAGWNRSLTEMQSLYDSQPSSVKEKYKHALPWAAAEGGGRSVFAEHCARARRATNDARIHARSVVMAARLAARAAAHREDVEETLQRDRDGGIDIASWHTGGAFRSEFF